MSAGSIVTGVALVLVTAVAAPAGADPAPADLAVTASGEVHAQVGVPYSHTFTVANRGGSPAADAHVVIEINGRDIGPGGTTLLSPPLGCKTVTTDPFGSTALDCALGTIDAGHSVSRSITVSVTSAGFYQHGAFASTSSPESTTANNSAAASATVSAGPAGGLLGIVSALLLEVLGAVHL